jgi:hypothetical protein
MAYSSAVTLTVNEVSRSGKAVQYPLVAATATHGNKALNDGKTWLRVKNGSASPITATINTNRTIDGLTVPNLTVTIAATGDGTGLDHQDIGPFPMDTFNQSDGYVWITFSAVTTVTVGAFRLSNA